MYININKIENVSPYNIYCIDDNLCLIDKKNKNLFSVDINDIEVLWKTNEKNYSFSIVSKYIVTNNLLIYDLNGKKVYEDKELVDWYDLELSDNKNNLVIYKTINEEKEIALYHLFDVNKLVFRYKNIIIPSPKEIINPDLFICEKNNVIFLFDVKEKNILWQKDISKLTHYTEWDDGHEEGNIRQVYAYEDSIIVITQVFILRIDTQTGNIIYSLRLPTGLMSLFIIGDKGYGCYGYHYMEIDLGKGELLNYLRIENAIYKGQEYDATMNKATFHNGYVFHGLRLEGGMYAVGAINVATGKREWLDLLSVNMVGKIQFHQDKMFISDTGGNLFIYEKI